MREFLLVALISVAVWVVAISLIFYIVDHFT